jgi:hypothetical protein
MKTLHLAIIVILATSLVIGSNAAFADVTNTVYIQDIKVQPSPVQVGETFTVSATLVNNSTFPIAVDGGKCSVEDTQAELFTIMLDNHVKNKAENINCAGVGWSPLLDAGKRITGTSPDYTTNYVATEPGTATITVTFSYHTIIQTNPIQTSAEQTISKSFLFTISDNNTRTKTANENVLSPLKQFNSGIAAKDVKCDNGLSLVIKGEDGSPACVKPDTVTKLESRGWAAIPTTANEYKVPESVMPCNTPYPQSNTGVAVLYMPANSMGKICVRYYNGNDFLATIYPPRMADPNNNNQNAANITIWSDLVNNTFSKGNLTEVYWIKTGNQTGFYGLTVSSCIWTPFAVGYDNNSRIVASDFPFVGVTVSCPALSTYSQIDGLTGIGVKYIPYP